MKPIVYIIVFILLVAAFIFFVIGSGSGINDPYLANQQDAPSLLSSPSPAKITTPAKITSTTTSTTTSIKDVANSSELQNLLNTNQGKLVVLKAFTDTCPVCKAYGPTYVQFPTQYPNVVFAQYNAGRPTDLTTKLQLSTVPTTTFYVGGNSTPISNVVGIQLAQIKQTIEAHKDGK